MYGTELTRKLVEEKKYSKYKIAKICKVSWATVQLWYKGTFQPKEENLISLKKIEIEAENEKN